MLMVDVTAKPTWSRGSADAQSIAARADTEITLHQGHSDSSRGQTSSCIGHGASGFGLPPVLAGLSRVQEPQSLGWHRSSPSHTDFRPAGVLGRLSCPGTTGRSLRLRNAVTAVYHIYLSHSVAAVRHKLCVSRLSHVWHSCAAVCHILLLQAPSQPHVIGGRAGSGGQM